METPLSDDEKRALLAEVIKTSNVDPEALAGFVRANCPTYDILAVQLPNGRSLYQCAWSLERMLDTARTSDSGNGQGVPAAPSSYYGLESIPMLLEASSRISKSDLASVRPYSFDDSCTFGDPRSCSPGSSLPYPDRDRSISPSARSQSDSEQAPLPPKAHEGRETIYCARVRGGRGRGRGAPGPGRGKPPHARWRYMVPPYSSGVGTDQFGVLRERREPCPPRQVGKVETPLKLGQRSRDGGKDTSDAQGADKSPLPAKNASTVPHAVLPVPAKHRNDFSRQEAFRPRSRMQLQVKGSGDSVTSSRTETPPKSIDGNPSLVTDDVCNAVLKAAFSTSLDKLDTPTEVWECVYHCVNEVSHIIGRNNHCTAQNGPSQPGGSGPTPFGDSSRRQSAKRGRRELGAPGGVGGAGEDEDGDGNDQIASPYEGLPNKKQRRYAGFGCPFRKRNPLRFNVRSHLNCTTQTFSSITLLKRHVITFHKRPTQTPLVTCARCGEEFSTQADLDGHLRAESGDMCRVGAGAMPESAPDPEDGIGPDVIDRLRDRTAKRQVLEWATLWNVLFPEDTVPGAEFNPVIELDEVEAIFQNELDTLPPALRGRLQTAIELSSGIPAATALAEAAYHVFTGFFTGITQKSRATLGPVVKTRQHNRPALPPSTQTTVTPYSDAPGQGKLPSLTPAPHTAYPSLCAGCFQPASTSCTCFPDLGLDFDHPTLLGSSAPNWGFAST